MYTQLFYYKTRKKGGKISALMEKRVYTYSDLAAIAAVLNISRLKQVLDTEIKKGYILQLIENLEY